MSQRSVFFIFFFKPAGETHQVDRAVTDVVFAKQTLRGILKRTFELKLG